MTHLFISHSTRDGGAIAQQLAAALEAAGYRCWIAPRDVKPGLPYPGQIVTAIESCSGLVLVVTPAANESPDVLQEIQLANAARKVIAPVVVNATAPGPDMRYYISVRHQIPWGDARAVTAELMRSFPSSDAALAPGSPLARQFAETLSALAMKGIEVGYDYDVFMLMTGENKINVIKIVRQYTGGGLVETKLLLEGFPPIRVGIEMPYERAKQMIRDLQAVGATMMPLTPHQS